MTRLLAILFGLSANVALFTLPKPPVLTSRVTGVGSGFLTVNEGTPVTFTATEFSAQYLAIGQVQAGSGTAGTLYFDLVTVDAP